MTLHIFNNLRQCELKLPLLVNANDAVLLIEEAVYMSRQAFNSPLKLYVLQEDIIARGLKDHVSDSFSMIDYEGFVELSEMHNKSISW